VLFGNRYERLERIERAGVDVTRLKKNDRRTPAGATQRALELGRIHRFVGARFEIVDVLASESRPPHEAIDGSVPAPGGNGADRRSAGQAACLDVPVGSR
jgi:hypothetical protein